MGKRAVRVKKRKGFLGVSPQEVSKRKAQAGASSGSSECQRVYNCVPATASSSICA